MKMKAVYFSLVLIAMTTFSCDSRKSSSQPVEVKQTYTHPQTKEYPSTFNFSRVVINMGINGTQEVNKPGIIYIQDGQLMISFEDDIRPARAITSVGVGVPLEDGKYSYNFSLYYMGNILLTEFVDKDGKPYRFKFTTSGGWTEDYYGN